MAAKKTIVKKESKKTVKSKSSPVRAKRVEKTADISMNKPLPLVAQKTPEVKTKKGVNKTLLTFGIIVVVLGLLFIFRSAIVVAFVNGQPVWRADFNAQMQKDAGKQALNEIVTKDLIFQEAQKKNIVVSKNDVDKQLASITDTLKKQGQTLDQALSAKGLTRQDLEDQIKIKIIVDKLLTPQIKVTDKEVQDYMDKNQDQLPQGEKTDALKASIKAQMIQQKLQEKFQTWIQDLQNKAKINYFIKI